MATARAVSLVALIGLACAVAAREGTATHVNPIRRVVTMLQNMQEKVIAEGKRDHDLYEKFMCWCQTGAGDLQKSISEAETKMPQLESSINEGVAEQAQLAKDIEEAKKSRAAGAENLAKATALREKEAGAYAKESADYQANILAIRRAVAAIEKGQAGFLQTSTASVVRKLTIDMDLSNVDREMLTSFLAGGEGYVPQSGQIVGILKQMGDTMEKDLKDIIAAEEAARANYAAMAGALKKEADANTREIEAKLTRQGELGVELVNMREDLDDTTKSLMEDKKFLGDLEKNCGTKKEEYQEVKKQRADELVALADTIRILNDDDSLELFKKTLPTPALLETAVTSQKVKRQALLALRKGGKDSRLDLIALALSGRRVNFEKVIAMIDDMVVLLGKEQKDDDEKKAFCETELDKAEDELKVLDQTVDDLGKRIADIEEGIATLTEEIAALVKGIKELDNAVAEATATRKEEHEEFNQNLADDTAAKEILGIAKNRLNKFYNPRLYVPEPKRDLSESERIVVNQGGTLAPTAAPGGIAGTGVTAFVQVAVRDATDSNVAPPPPPEAVKAYQKKGQESSAVIEMIGLLETDLDKEIATLKTDEKNAQEEYEQFMQDSAAKRAADSKSLREKEGAKADLEADLEKTKTEKKAKTAEAMAKAEQLHDLHLECDWLLSNFQARKEARAGEVESLKNAKAVLSGADYSLVQSRRLRLRRAQ